MNDIYRIHLSPCHILPALIFTSRCSAWVVRHVDLTLSACVRFDLPAAVSYRLVVLRCFQFTFECECLPGFTGQKCETEIDFCANVTCENGATCYSLTSLETFECSCVEGVCCVAVSTALGSTRTCTQIELHYVQQTHSKHAI